MELTGDRFKNYHTEYSDSSGKPIETLSLGRLMEHLKAIEAQCALNKIDPYTIPSFVKISGDGLYVMNCTSFGCGDIGSYGCIEIFNNERLQYVAPDIEDPASDEVEWLSRGVSDGLDVSGFVNSRQSGMRLLHMVQDILGKEDVKSWLDYRKLEPKWIQFKFTAKEFDVRKIDELAKKNGNKLNKRILKECKII